MEGAGEFHTSKNIDPWREILVMAKGHPCWKVLQAERAAILPLISFIHQDGNLEVGQQMEGCRDLGAGDEKKQRQEEGEKKEGKRRRQQKEFSGCRELVVAGPKGRRKRTLCMRRLRSEGKGNGPRRHQGKGSVPMISQDIYPCIAFQCFQLQPFS